MVSRSRLTEGVHDVACLSCKSRKIRCDRIKPQCDCCFARHQTCVYPKGKKRAKALKLSQSASELRKRIVEVERGLQNGFLRNQRPTLKSKENYNHHHQVLNGPVLRILRALEA
ncbi:hypothetical protein V2G26_019259 [Clonostachys chloroleuca]